MRSKTCIGVCSTAPNSCGITNMAERKALAECGSPDHWSRRALLKAAGLAGASWMTHVAERLARAQVNREGNAPARSMIFLWLEGGPSQLETFDPHPNAMTGGIDAIATKARDVKIAKFYPHLAEEMDSISL